MKGILLALVWWFATGIFSLTTAYAQDCKVLVEQISGAYSGECKNGLAHGEGVAKGARYKFEGEFKKGYPDGKGTLVMPDSSVFAGEWNMGEAFGFGELMNAKGEKVSGYFKGPMEDFRLMGQDKSSLAGYKILSTERLENATYTFVKSDEGENTLVIKIFENNIRRINNFEILEITSGVIHVITNNGGRLTADIINITYPITIGVRYILPYGTQDTNLPGGLANLNSPRSMRFTISEPGQWTVTITHR